MNKITSRLLKYVGSILAIFGILFVSYKLYYYFSSGELNTLTWSSWLYLGVLILVYTFVNLCLASAWQHLLMFFGAKINWFLATKIYALSQIAKYIPGNIVHLAGRQAIGVAENIPGGPLLKSTFSELALIAFSGTLFSILLTPLLFPPIGTMYAVALSFLLIIVAGYLLTMIFNRQITISFFYHVGFLLLSGIIFLFIMILVLGISTTSDIGFEIIIGAYVISWLVGFVTPGAPAGVGIRELVLIYLLGSHVANADLIFTIALLRLITVIGDLLFYLLAAVGVFSTKKSLKSN